MEDKESDIIKKFRINAYSYIEKELRRLFPDITIEYDEGISMVVKKDRRDAFTITKYIGKYFVIKTNSPFTEGRSPHIYHETPSNVINTIYEDYKNTPYTDNTASWINEITTLLREKLPYCIITDRSTHIDIQVIESSRYVHQITKYTWPMITYTLDITHTEFITKTFTSNDIVDLVNIIYGNLSEDYHKW